MGVSSTMYTLVTVLVSLVASVSCLPRPQAPGQGPLPIPREGSYGPEDYFQYINVPAHKVFEWGYRRGNPDHNREEYLSQKDHTFKAKLKWHDAYGGHGEHYYDYNHGGGYEEPHAPSYAAPAPAYHAGSERDETYVAAPVGDARNRRSIPLYYFPV